MITDCFCAGFWGDDLCFIGFALGREGDGREEGRVVIVGTAVDMAATEFMGEKAAVVVDTVEIVAAAADVACCFCSFFLAWNSSFIKQK